MNQVINLFALAAVVAASGYMLLLLVSRLTGEARTQRHFARQRELLDARIKRTLNPVAQLSDSKATAWSGIRKFVVRNKVLEADGVCSFYLTPHDGRPLPPFLPGQYLTFQLDIPGDRKPLTRCYSLSDAPINADYYRVSIKRVPPPRDKPELPSGKSSSFFHDKIQIGDLLDVKAPSGHFYLNVDSDAPVVLIGGGIGLTPVLSMLNFICDSQREREVWFFYGVRNKAEHAMADHLRELAKGNPKLKLNICYSDPSESDVKGQDYDHAERVSVDLFKRVLPSNNYEFYICGPPPMMSSLTEALEEWGVPESRVHFEAFGPASVKKVAHTEVASAEHTGVEVTFALSDKKLMWDGESNSLLEFAEANGITLDSGCRAGGCGTCATAIRSGSVDYLQSPDADVEKGYCLTCISVPKSALTLEA